MYAMNFLSAHQLMKGNVIKSFTAYLSDILSFILFVTSSVSVIYFFLFDTSFLASIGVYENELTLGIASFFAVIELTALYFIHFYFRLKKNLYFSCSEKVKITFFDTIRAAVLAFVTFIKKLFALFAFMSPFLLSVSAIYFLIEGGYSQNVIFLCVGSSSLLFVFGLMFYRMYILKYSLIFYVLTNNGHLTLKEIYEVSENLTDGKIIGLFILKLLNIPKKLFSFFIIPLIYYLPYCKYCEYNFLLQKENPYSESMNTDKSVVFYVKKYGGL